MKQKVNLLDYLCVHFYSTGFALLRFAGLDFPRQKYPIDAGRLPGVTDGRSMIGQERFKVRQGHKSVDPYSLKKKNEIAISKLKVGFPAFHVAPVKFGRNLFSKLKNSSALYVNPEWKVDDLFPAIYRKLELGDEAKRVVILGRALGLFSRKEGKYTHGNRELGSSPKDIEEYLRSFRGSSVRNKLVLEIEEQKKKPGSLDKLISFKEKRKLDKIEEEMIDKVISELNPLA